MSPFVYRLPGIFCCFAGVFSLVVNWWVDHQIRAKSFFMLAVGAFFLVLARRKQ